MNLANRLIEADRSSPKRILVVGDCMFDTYVGGRLEPTCQEGCPKFVEESSVTVPGGAANAARSLEKWESGRRMYYEVGGGSGVECLPGKGPSLPQKVRFMDSDRCVFRYDDDLCGLNMELVRDEAKRVLREWQPHAVLLSDYDKGMLEPEFIKYVTGICFGRGIPCVADCKRRPSLYCGAVLKCNEDYLSRNSGALPFNNMVVTYGKVNPVTWDTETVCGLGYDLPDVQCVNHVGAGDCFAAHLALALAHGFSLKEAAAVAHSAGRVYVQHRHNEPPAPEAISADMGTLVLV